MGAQGWSERLDSKICAARVYNMAYAATAMARKGVGEVRIKNCPTDHTLGFPPTSRICSRNHVGCHLVEEVHFKAARPSEPDNFGDFVVVDCAMNKASTKNEMECGSTPMDEVVLTGSKSDGLMMRGPRMIKPQQTIVSCDDLLDGKSDDSLEYCARTPADSEWAQPNALSPSALMRSHPPLSVMLHRSSEPGKAENPNPEETCSRWQSMTVTASHDLASLLMGGVVTLGPNDGPSIQFPHSDDSALELLL